MRNFILLLLLIVAPIQLSLAYTTDPRPGYSTYYFKKFFQKTQPKEYYDFLKIMQNYKTDVSVVYTDYHSLDDFTKPNTWSISSPSAHFQDPYKNKSPITDEELLKWTTFPIEPGKPDVLPPNDRVTATRQSIPNLLGVRSLFLGSGVKTITIYPKTPIVLPEYNIKTFEFWAFGINQRYTIYVVFENSDHIEHKVWAGTMEFKGWKRIVAQINTNNLGRINHSLKYTKALDTQLKFKSIIFESKDIDQTDGFFGTWISDLGVSYSEKDATFPITADPSVKLAQSFDWDNNTAAAPAN